MKRRIHARPACLIVEAAPGNRLLAYSLIRRAIKAAGLQIASFVPLREAKAYDLPNARFVVDCTDEQADKLRNEGKRLADAEGWPRFPVDMYHD